MAKKKNVQGQVPGDPPQAQPEAPENDFTDRQWRFIHEYVALGNATKAACAAGYSAWTAQEQSSRLLSNVMIRAEVDRLLAEKNKEALAERSVYLRRLEAISAARLSDYIEVRPDGSRFIAWDKIPRDKLAAIKSFTDSPKLGMQIQLHDSHKATLDILEILKDAEQGAGRQAMADASTRVLERLRRDAGTPDGGGQT